MTGGQQDISKRTKLDDAKARFSKALTQALLSRTGKIPTANALANQFNYHAVGMAAVSRETARKWLTGQAIPEVPKLIVLVDWLGLDANEFMSSRAVKPQSDDDLVIETLRELVRFMDDRTRAMVLLSAWSIHETQGAKPHDLDLKTLRRMLMANLGKYA